MASQDSGPTTPTNLWRLTGTATRMHAAAKVTFMTLEVTRKPGRQSFIEIVAFSPEARSDLDGVGRGEYVTIEGYIDIKKDGERESKDGRKFPNYVPQLIAERLVNVPGQQRQPPPRQEPDLPPPDDASTGAPPPDDSDVPF